MIRAYGRPVAILSAVLLVTMGLGLNIIPYVAAQGISVDGSGNCANGNSNTCTGTLTTTGSSDVIIVVEGTQSGHSALTPSDTAGLKWISRSDISNGGDDQHVYYATTTTTLSSDTITCNFNSNSRSSCIFFAISGALTSAPFDTNSGLPCTSSGTSATPTCTLSTTASSTMILGFATSGCDVATTADTGFTLILANNVCGPSIGVEYKIVSSPQTGLSVGMTLASSQAWVSSGDAIASAVTTSSSSSSSSSTTTTSTSSSTTSPNLAIDGIGDCSNGNANTCSATLTTTGSSDVVIVAEGTQSGHSALTPSDSAALAWTSRSDVALSGGDDQHIYYAITTKPLSSDTITCNFNSNSRSSCIFFGIVGALTSAPFVTSSGLSCTATGTSVSSSCSLSTTSSHTTMVLGFTTTGCDVAVTPDSGFTLIHANNACGPSMGIEYQMVSSPQTNLNVGMTLASSQAWVSSSDAVAAAASPALTEVAASTCGTTTAVYSCSVPITATAGNTIVLAAIEGRTSPSNCLSNAAFNPTDTDGIYWASNYVPNGVCGNGGYGYEYMWFAQAPITGVDTITVTNVGQGESPAQSGVWTVAAFIIAGADVNINNTGYPTAGDCILTSCNGNLGSNGYIPFTGLDLAVGLGQATFYPTGSGTSGAPVCVASSNYVVEAAAVQSGNYYGSCIEYSTTVPSPTNFPMTITAVNQNNLSWIDVGATFGATAGIQIVE